MIQEIISAPKKIADWRFTFTNSQHIQTIRRVLATNCLGVFKHFMGLALKGLTQVVTSEMEEHQPLIRRHFTTKVSQYKHLF